MRDILCMMLFFAAVACGGVAVVSIFASASETAPGTSSRSALTRGAFLGQKQFTERGQRLRRRAVMFQLAAMGLMVILVLACAEF